jgi:hypothetical protein
LHWNDSILSFQIRKLDPSPILEISASARQCPKHSYTLSAIGFWHFTLVRDTRSHLTDTIGKTLLSIWSCYTPLHTIKAQKNLCTYARWNVHVLGFSYPWSFSPFGSRRMASQVLNTSQYHLKGIALIGLIVAVCIWVLNNILKRWRIKQKVTRPSTPNLEKEPLGSKFKKSDRKPGGMLCPRPRVHDYTTNHRQSMQNGHLLLSKDQQHHPIWIGMSIRPSLYRIGRFDMDRKCPAVRS